MNILVTGANGQLGNEIRIASKNCQKDHYFFSDVVNAEYYLDITDYRSICDFVEKNNINCIINCAAYTNVEAAEDNPGAAYILNSIAPNHLAKVMAEFGGLLVHISTDYVFGREPYNLPCREEQKGTPIGMYGYTKFLGEKNILRYNCNYIIIRTAWLYSEFGKNFCKTMLNLTANKPSINVIFDQVGTPTYALDLANAIIDIIDNRKFEGNNGIYHYSNEGVCSWYDFTKMIAEYSGQTNCEINPCHSNEFPSKVVRPSYSVLDKTKIKDTFNLKIPYWTDSLKLCIKNLLEN